MTNDTTPSLNPSICTNSERVQKKTFMQVETAFDHSEYYKTLAKAQARADELMGEKPDDLLFEVTSHRNHKVLNMLPDDTLEKLFTLLPPLTTEEAYEELGHFKTLGNGMFKYPYQNLMLATLLKARNLSLNSSICTNNKTSENETFALVKALSDEFIEEEQDYSANDYPAPSVLEDEEATDDLSLNSSICTNNKTTTNETFVQVRHKKWVLQQNLFHPESIAYLITNECWAKITRTKDEMEDVISEALVQYYQLEADGEIDYEKAAQYWVRVAVNKTINKYKYDNANMRRKVDTVATEEVEDFRYIESYGQNHDEWYNSLSKSQMSAVDDASRKTKKEQKIGPTLRKRLGRVPMPVRGEVVHDYESRNLRDEHTKLRNDYERRQAEIEEKKYLSKFRKKRRTTTLKLKINAQGQIEQTQMPIPASLERISEPQTAGEGKDIGNNNQTPTVNNMENLRTQWQELLLEQLNIDIHGIKDHQVKYKLQRYADCLILSREFEQSLTELGTDVKNYKEIHNKLCLDSKNEEAIVAQPIVYLKN